MKKIMNNWQDTLRLKICSWSQGVLKSHCIRNFSKLWTRKVFKVLIWKFLMPECTEEGLPTGLDLRRWALHKLVQAADDLVLGQQRWATDSFTARNRYINGNSPVLSCSMINFDLYGQWCSPPSVIDGVEGLSIHLYFKTRAVLGNSNSPCVLGYNGAHLFFGIWAVTLLLLRLDSQPLLWLGVLVPAFASDHEWYSWNIGVHLSFRTWSANLL